MTTREVFLSRIRDRLAASVPGNIPHPMEPLEVVPEPAYAKDLSDPVAAFTASARSLGAVVDTDLEAILRNTGAKTAVCSRDPEIELVRPLLPAAGIDEIAFEGPASAAEADLGVAGGVWGVAATGTVVVDAGRAGGRSASLVTPDSLLVLRADRILPTASALFRRLSERFPDGLPSQLVLITGPSRSADIELVLTVGVHGPGRLWIAILEESEERS